MHQGAAKESNLKACPNEKRLVKQIKQKELEQRDSLTNRKERQNEKQTSSKSIKKGFSQNGR